MEEIEEGGVIEPDPGVNDQAQAAAEAVAAAEQPERELHSFEIEGAQVQPYTHAWLDWSRMQTCHILSGSSWLMLESCENRQ